MNLVALYRNLTTENFVNGPPLRRRLIYTALLLLLYRILADIPILHADERQLDALLADNPLIGLVDLFAGGEVLKHFSIVAAGLFPYLLAVAIVTAATWLLPRMREVRRQGEEGKKRIERYTLWLSVPLAIGFGWSVGHYLARHTGLFPGAVHWFTSESFFPSLWIVSLVTVGSLISKAVAKLISTQGLGKGESVVLAAGSSLVFVTQAIRIAHDARASGHLEQIAIAALIGVVIVVVTIQLTTGVRRIPVGLPRRTTTRREFVRPQTHIPMLVDHGGVLPVAGAVGLLALLEFADALLTSHVTSSLAAIGHALIGWATPSTIWYWIALALLIIAFTYLYNYSMLWQTDGPSLAEQLKRSGSFIPGVRPGEETDRYLSRVTARVTLPAALGLALIASALPYAILVITGQNVIVAVISLIVLVKTLDDVRRRIEAFRTIQSYEGIMKRTSLKRPGRFA